MVYLWEIEERVDGCSIEKKRGCINKEWGCYFYVGSEEKCVFRYFNSDVEERRGISLEWFDQSQRGIDRRRQAHYCIRRV